MAATALTELKEKILALETEAATLVVTTKDTLASVRLAKLDGASLGRGAKIKIRRRRDTYARALTETKKVSKPFASAVTGNMYF